METTNESVLKEAARKFVKEAILKLTLAVGRSDSRLAVPSDSVILTSNPGRTNASHSELLRCTVTSMSPTTLAFALEELKKRQTAAEGRTLTIQEVLVNRPWFDIRVEEQGYQLILTISTVHPIAA